MTLTQEDADKIIKGLNTLENSDVVQGLASIFDGIFGTGSKKQQTETHATSHHYDVPVAGADAAHHPE